MFANLLQKKKKKKKRHQSLITTLQKGNCFDFCSLSPTLVSYMYVLVNLCSDVYINSNICFLSLTCKLANDKTTFIIPYHNSNVAIVSIND